MGWFRSRSSTAPAVPVQQAPKQELPLVANGNSETSSLASGSVASKPMTRKARAMTDMPQQGPGSGKAHTPAADSRSRASSSGSQMSVPDPLAPPEGPPSSDDELEHAGPTHGFEAASHRLDVASVMDTASHMSIPSVSPSEAALRTNDVASKTAPPFPPRPRASDFVCDALDIVDKVHRDEIRRLCAQTLLRKDVPIVVAIVGSISACHNEIDVYATKLFDKWRLGGDDWNVALLFVASLHERKWRFSIRQGRDWARDEEGRTKVNKILSRILTERVLPTLTRRKPFDGSGAILEGVRALQGLAEYIDGPLAEVVVPRPAHVRHAVFGVSLDEDELRSVASHAPEAAAAASTQHTNVPSSDKPKEKDDVNTTQTHPVPHKDDDTMSVASHGGRRLADGVTGRHGDVADAADDTRSVASEIAPAATPAAAPRFYDEDFPPPLPEGEFICDAAAVLAPSQRAQANQTCRSVFAEINVPIVVVTVPSTGPYGENVQYYAEKLYNLWGIGAAKWSVGLLLLCVRDPPKWLFCVRYGAQWADAHGQAFRVDQTTRGIVHKLILPTLQQSRPMRGDKAILAGLKGLAQMAGYLDGPLGELITPRPPHTSLRLAYNGGRAYPLPHVFSNVKREQSLFPPRIVQGNWFDYIQDSAAMLEHDDARAVRAAARALFNQRRIPVLVFTVKELKGTRRLDCSDAEKVAIYGHALFNHYGIGLKDFSYGVLLLVARGSDPCVIAGSDWSAKQCERLARAIPAMVDVAKRTQSISHAIVAGVNAVARLVAEETLEKRAPHVAHLSAYGGGRTSRKIAAEMVGARMVLIGDDLPQRKEILAVEPVEK